jgi:RNA polymerase sigma-70 factor (ECF subfamily)
LLCELVPNDAESIGLSSLMMLQDSRREARIDHDGNLVTLDQQDRSRWDQIEIDEGLELVERALRLRRPGTYQLQAAIAALHSEAKSAAETDWRQIVALYRELMRMSSSPVISLNHAVAVAMSEGIEQGLALVDRLRDAGELKNYYPYHAARADLLRRLKRVPEAVEAYQQALRLASNRVDQQFIHRRLKECGWKR